MASNPYHGKFSVNSLKLNLKAMKLDPHSERLRPHSGGSQSVLWKFDIHSLTSDLFSERLDTEFKESNLQFKKERWKVPIPRRRTSIFRKGIPLPRNRTPIPRSGRSKTNPYCKILTPTSNPHSEMLTFIQFQQEESLFSKQKLILLKKKSS